VYSAPGGFHYQKGANMYLDQEKAIALAKLVDGEAVQTGGDVWLVLKRIPGGKLVVFSGDEISCYENETAFDAGEKAQTSICLY
jgi:hypothetical protein